MKKNDHGHNNNLLTLYSTLLTFRLYIHIYHKSIWVCCDDQLPCQMEWHDLFNKKHTWLYAELFFLFFSLHSSMTICYPSFLLLRMDVLELRHYRTG